jgi:hypothetical protein
LIGFQEYVINNNINVKELAKEINISSGCIWRWFQVNRVSKKYIDILADKFNLPKEYINEIINEISTYKPKKRGFNEYKIFGDATEIYAHRKDGKDFTILIDTEDLPKLLELDCPWSANCYIKNNWIYARASIYIIGENGKKKIKPLRMHQFILGVDSGIDVDHINHNTLDNRKSNLRIIPHELNTRNRKAKNSNNKSGYRNVFWDTRNEKWRVTICKNYKHIFIGLFDDVDEAGNAAEKAREEYFGIYKGKS